MKAAGLTLIAIGFLAGSLAAVQTEANTIPWIWFGPALAMGTLGVVLARVGTHQVTRHEGLLTSNVETLRVSIDRIVEEIVELDGIKKDLHPFELHTRIDAAFPDHLAAFVEARESIGHVYGLPAYADVMNEFAAGERYLNRVWSASVDCYIEDVHEYLGRSRHQFEETRRKLQELAAGSGRND